MARNISLNQVDDAHDAVQAVVTELESCKLVCLPDECGWQVVGLATEEAAGGALQRLQTQLPQATPVVSLGHPQAVADYVTDAPKLFWKLAARCWPGPVVLRGGGDSEGLARQWPAVSRQWSQSAEGRAFYCPAESFTLEVLTELSAPALGLLFCRGDAELPEVVNEATSLVVSSARRTFSDPPTRVNLGPERLQIEQPGVVSERLLARLAGEVYLFVCTGNTCRSPMAEAMFRKMLADRLKCREDELLDRGYVVVSAGLAAFKGAAAAPEAIEILRLDGIDLQSHESQPVTEELLFHCDQIITMTRSHREAVLSAYPELSKQVRLLSPNGDDVADPLGAGQREYVRCRDEICSHLERLLDEIVP